MIGAPFWPRKSPHFLQVRVAVRRSLEVLGYPNVVCVVLSGRADTWSLCEACVGVSGGADSLELRAALWSETHGKHRKFLALCIDHALQGGSDKVAETAAAHARRWGAEAQVIAVEITPDSPAGMEAEARRVRYQAFAQATQTMQEEGTSRGEKLAVFVAHTA